MSYYERWVLETEHSLRDREDDIDYEYRRRIEDDIAYREGYREYEDDIAYRERLYEEDILYYERMRRQVYEDDIWYYERMRRQEVEHRERMPDWDIAERERLLEEDPHYREREVYDESAHTDIDTAEGVEEGWDTNKEWGDEAYETEDWNTYEEWGDAAGTDGVDEGWNIGEEWTDTGDETWSAEAEWYDNAEECDYMGKDSDGAQHSGEMEAKDETLTKEVVPAAPIIKLRRSTCIPFCYIGPLFDSKYSEYVVQVTPVMYMDVSRLGFDAITSNANSFRLVVKAAENNPSGHCTLEVMAKSERMRDLMKGIMLLKFCSSSVTISIEQREADDSNSDMRDEEGNPVFFPTIINKASFRINSLHIRAHVSETTTSFVPEDRSEKQSTLYLHNLPISVKATFLQMLFPFCQKTLVKSESRSAAVQMSCAKMALLHMTSIKCFQVNGRAIEMKIGVPEYEGALMLQETEQTRKEARQKELQRLKREADEAKLKRRKLSPSDVRRRLKRKQEYAERVSRTRLLPQAPLFPGIPSLLNMSFSGPGNTPAQGARNPAVSATGAKPWTASGNTTSGARDGAGPSSALSGTDADDFPFIPIPQLLEPSPEMPPEMPPDYQSEKIRTKCYYRRRASRIAVHLCHLWGGDIEAAGKALAYCAAASESKDDNIPRMMAPPHLLSTVPLTENQLQALRKKVKQQVLMDDMHKAEEHWQRKRKEKEALARGAASQGGTDGQKKTHAKILRDRQRMTEFNRRKNALAQDSKQVNADTGPSGNGQPVASRGNLGPSSQGNASAATQSDCWESQKRADRAPSAQLQYSRPAAHQPTEPPQKRGRFIYGQGQPVQQSSHPPAPKPQQSRKQYPQPPSPAPTPPPQSRYYWSPSPKLTRQNQSENFRPPPPKPTLPPQGQSFCPPPLQSQSFRPPVPQGQSFRPPPHQGQSFHPPPPRGQSLRSPPPQGKNIHPTPPRGQNFRPPPPQDQSFHPPPPEGQNFHPPPPKPTPPPQGQNFRPPPPKPTPPPQSQNFLPPPPKPSAQLLPPPPLPPKFASKPSAQQNQVSTDRPSKQQHQTPAHGWHGQGQQANSWRSQQTGTGGGYDSSRPTQAQPRQQQYQDLWQSGSDLQFGSERAPRRENAGNQQWNAYQQNYEQYYSKS